MNGEIRVWVEATLGGRGGDGWGEGEIMEQSVGALHRKKMTGGRGRAGREE